MFTGNKLYYLRYILKDNAITKYKTRTSAKQMKRIDIAFIHVPLIPIHQLYTKINETSIMTEQFIGLIYTVSWRKPFIANFNKWNKIFITHFSHIHPITYPLYLAKRQKC